jgi:hypothetical protein
MENLYTTGNVVFISSTSSAYMSVSRMAVGQLIPPTTTQLDVYGLIRLSSGITTMGGASRGSNANDLQLARTAVTQVASGASSAIGGGASNTASGGSSVVSGGSGNLVSGDFSNIGGGSAGTINTSQYCTIGGGSNNSIGANTSGAVIGGGNTNTLDDASDPTLPSTIAGGKNNTANNGSTVGGGRSNSAQLAGTVSGGVSNSASNQYGAIGGGQSNTCSGSNCVIGGGNSNTASGQYSVVPGGYNNSASGISSLAAGRSARATAQGSFTLADFGDGTTFTNNSTDSFKARFAGGYDFTGGATTVTYIYGNGSGLSGTPGEANTYASSKTFSGAGGVLLSGAIAPTAYILTASSANAATMYGVTGGGHVVSSGTTPSISCNAGTGVMAADSNDMSGQFVAGSAAANCTLTFVNAFSKKPRCWCNDESAIVVVQAISTTTTLKCSVAISMSGDTLTYGCMGAP